MSKVGVVAVGVLATLSIAPMAQAVPIIDSVIPAEAQISSASTTSPCPSGFECSAGQLTFDHRITDDGFKIGDSVTEASLVIHLGEIRTTGVNHERYRYDIGSETYECTHGNCVPNSGLLDVISLNEDALADLADDGVLRVTINALSGDFLFISSQLIAEFAPHIKLAGRSAVPLPATLFLLGAGLLALGATRRIRF